MGSPAHEQEKSKGGRPRKTNEGALSRTMAFRLRPKLEKQLREAASIEGRSMSEEVEARVTRSFLMEAIEQQRFGDPSIAFLANLIAATASLIQLKSGKSFLDDAETFQAVSEAVSEIFDCSREIFSGVSNVPGAQRRFDHMVYQRIISDMVGTAGAASIDLKDVTSR